MSVNRTLILHSAARESGTNNDFTLALSPALHNVRRAKLLFASLPSAADNTHPYFIIRIQEFTPRVIGTNHLQAQGNFIIPVTAAGGYRQIHQMGEDYASWTEHNGDSLHTLTIRIWTGLAG